MSRTSHDPIIELRHLTKRFSGRLAVDDLSLVVPRGEIYGLLGHNGAGKSTTIGMMLGQVWPSAGELRICGHDVTIHRRRALARVGAIFEAPVFYDYLTGWQNLEMLVSYTAPAVPARLRETIDWVGLSGREHSRVRTYSHGMRARLAIAQALLPDPDLLILDEPGNGLDPEGIHEMRHTILRLRQELGLTILLSSHLLNEVEQLCTRIAVMNQGRKLFEGSVLEALGRQNSLRLRVGEFSTAVEWLRARNLITAHAGHQLVTLADGVGSDQVVRCLVEQGMPVFEVVAQEKTLEDFYLTLMKANGN
ncbi:MAG: type transport system ATP-binding protein [Verrucomicrobiota bacterium]|jgi:ABC-2 type transport system ATP-binding protein